MSIFIWTSVLSLSTEENLSLSTSYYNLITLLIWQEKKLQNEKLLSSLLQLYIYISLVANYNNIIKIFWIIIILFNNVILYLSFKMHLHK